MKDLLKINNWSKQQLNYLFKLSIWTLVGTFVGWLGLFILHMQPLFPKALEWTVFLSYVFAIMTCIFSVLTIILLWFVKKKLIIKILCSPLIVITFVICLTGFEFMPLNTYTIQAKCEIPVKKKTIYLTDCYTGILWRKGITFYLHKHGKLMMDRIWYEGRTNLINISTKKDYTIIEVERTSGGIFFQTRYISILRFYHDSDELRITNLNQQYSLKEILLRIDATDDLRVKINEAAQMLLDCSYEESISAYKQISSDHYELKGICYEQIGTAYSFLGKFKKAIEYYQKAIHYGADGDMMNDNIEEAREAITNLKNPSEE